MAMKKNKLLTATVAVVLTAAIALGGTFAWQSISQQALNEAAATINPGGRLHDDFDGRNKDVYVENFTDADDGTVIFARIRLDEYMELGVDAGINQDQPDRNVDPVVAGTSINDKDTWVTRVPGDTSSPFAEYWEWQTGGQTIYMPTFNKNKDSLQADINGTWDGTSPDDDVHYDDYQTYSLGQEITANATYDDDNNDIEDDGIRTESETHAAVQTINGTVITMAEWQALPAEEKIGDFWVWDDDGWAYWASPIEPSTSTGLLLDGIELVNPPSDNYYYGINVVGQFVTADDIGFLNGTGFYDRSEGRIPSEEAEELLELITGTDIEIPPTDGQVDSSTSEEIRDAVVNGSQYEAVTIDDTEWYVLAIDYDTDRALILSRYVLETRTFDADGSVYWKDSDLREYLNGDWLRGQETLYNAAVETTLYNIERNTEVLVEDDMLTSTQDKVFLLSYTDLNGAIASYDPRLSTYYEYMPLEGNQGDVLPDLLTEATTADGTPTEWWTRTYAYTNGQVTPYRVRSVSDEGTGTSNSPTDTNIGVRPALWIQLDTDKDLTLSDTLDYETSAAIRAAEISDMGLTAAEYDTVLIDGIEWYVLEVQDNKALLLSRYLHPQHMRMVNDINKYVDEEQAERFFPDVGVNYVARSQTSDTIWATSDLHDYLNGEWLSMHPTLNAAVAETEIYTRFYLSERSTYQDEEFWCNSTDNVFLLSTADVFGTTFDIEADPGSTQSVEDTLPADDAREYTLGTVGVILPEALRTADIFLQDNPGDPTGARDWGLRTSWHHSDSSGDISGGSYLTEVDMDGNLKGLNRQQYFYFRPAMWVNINSSTSTITVTPPEDPIEYNTNQTLEVAVMTSTGLVESPAVTWTIRGATSADTRFVGNTLYIGEDEVSRRLQVVAAYNDGGQSITDTVYVLVNPAPARLDAEASAFIRNANISQIGLEQEASEYDTVTIDGVEFYVLAVDEDNDLALLFSKDVVATHVMRNTSDTTEGAWNAYGSSWTARDYLHEEWLPNHSILSQVAQETEISFYTSSYFPTMETLESSIDTVFLPSYADLTGLDARDEEEVTAAEVPGEYTWGNSKLIPDSLRAANCIEGVSASTWWLRTSVLDVNSVMGTRASFKTVYCSNGNLNYTTSQRGELGIRPMMWVRISAE